MEKISKKRLEKSCEKFEENLLFFMEKISKKSLWKSC